MVSLKYREDMNYITVDGCSSQEKEEGEKSRKRQTQRDFNWHVGAGHLAKHLGTLKENFCGGNFKTNHCFQASFEFGAASST